MNQLVPMPLRIIELPELFHPRPGLRLIVNGYPESAIPVIHAQLSTVFGVDLPLTKASMGRAPLLIIYEGAYEPDLARAREALDELLLKIDDPRIRSQAYALAIGREAVVIAAGGEPGLFHAVQTLTQLVTPQGNLAGALIQDRPALVYRGLLQDMSRGQVMTLKALKQLVRTISHYKYNQLTFNIEHTFAFSKHPAIGQGHDPISPHEVRELVDFAKDYHVEIVPSQQSLGHLYHVLKLPEYQHLAYDPQRPWSLDPNNEQSYQLLQDMYDQIIPCYDSDFFNICCDEAFDLAANWDLQRAGGKTFPQAFLGHISRLKKMLEDKGKTTMVWADMLLNHPELLPKMPQDTMLMHWKYGTGELEGPEIYRTTLNPIVQAGLPFFTCTCSWTLMKIFPSLEVMKANNCNFITVGKMLGAEGNWLTNWGDMGHMNLLGLLAYPLVYAAEQMWADKPADEQSIRQAFAWTFWDDAKRDSLGLIDALQRVNIAMMGMPMFGGIGFMAFLDEPLCGDFILGFDKPAETAAELNAAADQAEVLYSRLIEGTTKRKAWLRDIELPIRQVRILADKMRFHANAYKVFNKQRGSRPDSAQTKEGIANLIRETENLADNIIQAKDVLMSRWLAQSSHSDLDRNLARYDKLVSTLKLRNDQLKLLHDMLCKNQKLPSWKKIQHAPEFKECKFNLIEEMGLSGLLG